MVALWLINQAQKVKPELVRRSLLLYVLAWSSKNPGTFEAEKVTQSDLLWRAEMFRVYPKNNNAKAFKSDLLWMSRTHYAYEEKGFWTITKEGREYLERIEATIDHRNHAFKKLLNLSSVELDVKRRQSTHNLFNNLLRLFQ